MAFKLKKQNRKKHGKSIQSRVSQAAIFMAADKNIFGVEQMLHKLLQNSYNILLGFSLRCLFYFFLQTSCLIDKIDLRTPKSII